jgi:hypothetical protein
MRVIWIGMPASGTVQVEDLERKLPSLKSPLT